MEIKMSVLEIKPAEKNFPFGRAPYLKGKCLRRPSFYSLCNLNLFALTLILVPAHQHALLALLFLFLDLVCFLPPLTMILLFLLLCI